MPHTWKTRSKPFAEVWPRRKRIGDSVSDTDATHAVPLMVVTLKRSEFAAGRPLLIVRSV